MNQSHQTGSRSRTFHRRVVWCLAIALLILHHDFWWWDSRELVLGFLPIGLAYHMMFSLAAGALWVYAIFCAWPSDLEAWADAEESAGRAKAVGGGADGGGSR